MSVLSSFRGFFFRLSGFPPTTKTLSKFKFSPETLDELTLRGVAKNNSHFLITVRFKVGSLSNKYSSPNRTSVSRIRLRTDLLFAGQSYGSEGPRSPNSELQHDAMSMLLAEIRSLRVQLEKSIQTNNALRLKLEEQLSRPLSSSSQSPSRSQVTVIRQLNFSEGKSGDDVGSVRGEPVKMKRSFHVLFVVPEVCVKCFSLF